MQIGNKEGEYTKIVQIYDNVSLFLNSLGLPYLKNHPISSWQRETKHRHTSKNRRRSLSLTPLHDVKFKTSNFVQASKIGKRPSPVIKLLAISKMTRIAVLVNLVPSNSNRTRLGQQAIYAPESSSIPVLLSINVSNAGGFDDSSFMGKREAKALERRDGIPDRFKYFDRLVRSQSTSI